MQTRKQEAKDAQRGQARDRAGFEFQPARRGIEKEQEQEEEEEERNAYRLVVRPD